VAFITCIAKLLALALLCSLLASFLRSIPRVASLASWLYLFTPQPCLFSRSSLLLPIASLYWMLKLDPYANCVFLLAGRRGHIQGELDVALNARAAISTVVRASATTGLTADTTGHKQASQLDYDSLIPYVRTEWSCRQHWFRFSFLTLSSTSTFPFLVYLFLIFLHPDRFLNSRPTSIAFPVPSNQKLENSPFPLFPCSPFFRRTDFDCGCW
jgi:hypothetical protein